MFGSSIPSTDIVGVCWRVANVPTTEVVSLFDHLVGEREQRRRHREAERPGGRWLMTSPRDFFFKRRLLSTRSIRRCRLVSQCCGARGGREQSRPGRLVQAAVYLQQQVQVLMLEHMEYAVQALGFGRHFGEPRLKIYHGLLSSLGY
jgi:hypothetical protein